tara:strand:+ start:715 stop:945 length:231 start_codon:yes stop_codon:yes gene_type:complete
MPVTLKELGALDGYVHCATCIEETGGVNGSVYKQQLEVGMRNNTELYVNCTYHKLVIGRFFIKPVNTECDCCDKQD